ncbi:MAG: M48 family metallopeptidase [Chloroflexi bacterium]|nr:M48 family metallopeptidase [Chloroflexota bacterium]
MAGQRDAETARIDPDRQERAKIYGRIRRRLFLIELGTDAVFALVVLLSGISANLRQAASAVSGERVVVVALYFVVIYVAYSLVICPLSFYSGYSLPHRFDLSTQNLVGWLVDWAKSLAIALVFGLILVEIAYYLLAVTPDFWWLVMGLVVLFFNVVLANVAPIILVPIFYKMTPLEDGALAKRLVDLAAKAGARVKGVYLLNMSSRTKAANAALMGLGNTRRIVLGDTVLGRYTVDEIETLFAHELGHHVHSDIPKTVVLQSVGTLAALYVASIVLERSVSLLGFASIADIATLPLLALILGAVSLILLPLGNTLSRWFEYQADEYAVRMTGNAQAFRDAMTKLANQNLAEVEPSAWVEFLLYDHPAIGKRIKMAEKYL